MTVIRMNIPAKQAHNDNTRRQFVAVGFSVHEYLDIINAIDDTGLPFHVVMLEHENELIEFLHTTPHITAAVMIKNNTEARDNQGIVCLRKARKELSQLPTILVVKNDKEASFITSNHIADASLVYNTERPLEANGIFNAMWEAASHHQVAHANDDMQVVE